MNLDQSEHPVFMSESAYTCETPVALFAFNRPELTKRVFRRIAEVRPKRLLCVADAARPDRPEEEQRCKEVQAILSAVDWPCEVQTNFAVQNMGCRGRLITGLNWVFEQVEEAVILEDDVLPDPTFFRFCDEMLQRYRNDTRVAMVSGLNLVQDKTQAPDSYFFSQLTHIWGWASWRRAWATYDPDLTDWPAIKAAGLMRELFPKPAHQRYWTHVFDQMHSGTGPDTWDTQWFYTNLKNSVLSVTPGVNLVENLGFGPDATHTIYAADVPRFLVQPLQFPLQHPPAMVPLRHLDVIDQERSGSRLPTILSRVRNKLRRSLPSARRQERSF